MEEEVNVEISEKIKVQLQEEYDRNVKLVEAISQLSESKEWNVLKELVYDKSLKSIERQLLNESLAVTIDVNKLYRLQGEWAWAKQFCDTPRFIENIKRQLSELKKKIK